ncbi:MAG: IS6 family transposase, partial [Methanocaldococcus sp.]|nr:IS6 family transposase [Methanocaldococcus sp.]MCQ6254063.1 IS6 family transposase [Methanocaldococcus sp.]MCQ6254067.1 IS6 family transposase [Methanocaldococcus sp.]MCQ6254423.1 IS6 family transposase [Methanocaldococcus sp.]MCQ6254430.1 IS6 family transposase [Methanocaldococcus sp.]
MKLTIEVLKERMAELFKRDRKSVEIKILSGIL